MILMSKKTCTLLTIFFLKRFDNVIFRIDLFNLKVKDASPVAKLGLSLAELSIKAAVNTTKFAYKVIPKPEFVYDVEKKGK